MQLYRSNDTHPTMVIPELIRLMVERGLEMDDAIESVTRACAYTNHTNFSRSSREVAYIIS